MNKGLTVLAAAVAGAVAGVLLAPKSGKETREEILNRANDSKDRAGEKATHVKGVVKEGYDNLRATAADAKDEATALATHAKQSARELATEAKTRSGRVAKRSDRAAEEVASDLEKTNLKK